MVSLVHHRYGRRPRLAAALLLAIAGSAVPIGAGAAEFLVEPMTIVETKAVFGRVESRTIVPARARIGGTIRRIDVTEGDSVTEDQPIGLVVDDKIALQLDAADARIDQLRAQEANARTELERAQQLLARGVGAQSRLDQAKTAFDVVVKQVAAAIADRAVLEQQAREGEIQAPASGRVLTVPVTAGSVIMAGEEVARVASGHYYLRLSLPERHAAEIKDGDPVQIGARRGAASEAGTSTTTGRIVKVYPEIDAGRVIADVDVEGLGSYFVNERTLVWIPVGRRELLAVPPAAVITRHGIDFVRVQTEAGPQEVAVVLGEAIDDDAGRHQEILTGLIAGDRVLLP